MIFSHFKLNLNHLSKSEEFVLSMEQKLQQQS